MMYSDYKGARNLAWDILINENVSELPVRVSVLCRSMGIPVKYYNDGNNSGEVRMINGSPVILVAEHELPARQRFTVAHELGHILLGHVGKYELVNREPSSSDNPIEQAANVFASRLLAPACVLWGIGVSSAEDIERLCNISHAAAEFRWERMNILLERDMFLTSHLERKVYEQFLPYIQAHQISSETSGN